MVILYNTTVKSKNQKIRIRNQFITLYSSEKGPLTVRLESVSPKEIFCNLCVPIEN